MDPKTKSKLLATLERDDIYYTKCFQLGMVSEIYILGGLVTLCHRGTVTKSRQVTLRRDQYKPKKVQSYLSKSKFKFVDLTSIFSNLE